MSTTQEDILNQIATYIAARVGEQADRKFQYVGILPPLDRRDDYRNYPVNKFPFIGVAKVGQRFMDQTVNLIYPVLMVQVLFSNRGPASQVLQQTTEVLRLSDTIFDVLLAEKKSGNYFGIPETILDMQILDEMHPTFYTEVEKEKKAFTIDVFTLNIHLGAR